MSPGKRLIVRPVPAGVVPLWMVLASMDMTSWGVGQILAKKATDRLGAVMMVLLVSLIDGTGYVLLYLLLGEAFPALSWAYVFAGLSAVAGMLGYILYYEALLRGNVSVVGTISAASPLVTITGAMLFLGETPTATQAVGIALLVGVVLLLSYEPIGAEWRIPAAVALSVAILFLWGIWALLTKAAVESDGAGGFGPFHVIALYSITNFTMGPAYFLWRRRRHPPPDPSPRAFALAVVAILLLIVGIVATTVALSIGPASLIAAVSGSYPVVTALVAFLILREKATLPRVLALLLFVPGIVLVAF